MEQVLHATHLEIPHYCLSRKGREELGGVPGFLSLDGLRRELSRTERVGEGD